ncbi:tail-related protein [Citromicrobium phage vB_CbaS-RXM]|nr:tail-related protein [Citromicrobium phage vB_CbaS-RXM]
MSLLAASIAQQKSIQLGGGPAPLLTGFATAVSTGNGAQPPNYANLLFDDIGAYDAAAQSRLTLQNDALVRHVAGNFNGDNSAYMYLDANGGETRIGTAYNRAYVAPNTFAGVNAKGGIHEASAGDYYSVRRNTYSNASSSWQSIEIIDPSLKGCLVGRQTGVTIAGGSMTPYPWDTVVYDTNNFFDPVNPTGFTIPTDGWYRLSCSVYKNTSDYHYGLFHKNGSTDFAGNAYHQEESGYDALNLVTAPVYLLAGDFVELRRIDAQSGTFEGRNFQYMCIELVDPSIQRVLAMAPGGSATSSNPFISWGRREWGPASMFDPAVDPSRLFVPPGCTQARVSTNFSNSWQGRKFEVVTYHEQSGITAAQSCNTGALNIFGPWLPVAPGDSFLIRAYAARSRANVDNASSWWCLECR